MAKKTTQRKIEHQKLAQAARETVQAIVALLIAKYPIQEIILFDSLVKGNFDQQSDIDLAVAGILESLYFEALAKVNRLSRYPVDLKPSGLDFI